VSRRKRTAPRERTATPAELEDARQRWLRARGPTIRDIDITQKIPIVTMAELMEPRP
jgi:hypothetical protein